MIPFYLLSDLRTQEPDKFADAWFADESFAPVSAPPCPKCGKLKEPRRRQGELTIKWAPPIDKYSPGSDVIADFYLLGYPLSIMISDRFFQILEHSQFRSFRFGRIHMVQDPKLKKPNRITVRTKKRVWLPYLGPPLHELIVTGNADIDFATNQVEVSEHLVCSRCQRHQKVFLRPTNTEPWIVRRSDWDGSDFFRLRFPDPEFNSNSCYVTESLREFLIPEGITNLGFVPHGYID